jgi:hypothetical protein
MILEYSGTYINAKFVIKLRKGEEVKETKAYSGFFKSNVKVTKKTSHYVILHYVDHLGKERDFTWNCAEQAPVDEAYKELKAQIDAHKDEVIDKLVEKTLLGEDTNGDRN